MIKFPKGTSQYSGPYKLHAPSKTLNVKKVISVRTIDDYSSYLLSDLQIPEATHAEFSIETTYGDSHEIKMTFYKTIETDNPNYKKQYEEYKEALEKYHEQTKEWKKCKEEWDKEQEEQDQKRKKELYEQLKKEFEE